MRMRELDCESYSLAMESESEFYSSLSTASEGREASATAASNSSSAVGSLTGSLSQTLAPGATVGDVAPLPTSWVERPSATGNAQQSHGVLRMKRQSNTKLGVITVILAFSAILRW